MDWENANYVKSRNIEFHLIVPLYTPARGPKLAGRVLGSSPACLGPVAGVSSGEIK